jgi:hypothetical protein
MRLRLGPLTFPWPKADAGDDPYWDFFLHTPPGDRRNFVPDLIREAPEGMVNAVRAELHTPEVTTGHVKELATFLGADLVGVARLDAEVGTDGERYPFAVVCAVRAEHDPREAPGIGGQVPVQNGLYVTFVLSAWIRELGYRATATIGADGEGLAARAGLGTLNAAGRLVTPRFGTRVHVADVIRTDLPLAADG